MGAIAGRLIGLRTPSMHGQAVQTGRTYDNHFVSVITIKDRKVTHWRDYLDPVAVFNALGWPAH